MSKGTNPKIGYHLAKRDSFSLVTSGMAVVTLLKSKNLLDEIIWYRAKTEVLKNYVLAIWLHLGQHGTWPQRPLMPTLGQNLTRKR